MEIVLLVRTSEKWNAKFWPMRSFSATGEGPPSSRSNRFRRRWELKLYNWVSQVAFIKKLARKLSSRGRESHFFSGGNRDFSRTRRKCPTPGGGGSCCRMREVSDAECCSGRPLVHCPGTGAYSGRLHFPVPARKIPRSTEVVHVVGFPISPPEIFDDRPDVACLTTFFLSWAIR